MPPEADQHLLGDVGGGFAVPQQGPGERVNSVLMKPDELLIPRQHRFWRRLPAIFVSLALVAPALAETPPTVDRLDVVDRAIAVHGGDTYRASLTSFRQRSKSGEFRVVVEVRGDRFRYEVEGAGPGSVTRRVVATNAGVELFEGGAAKPVAASEVQRLRDWVMARVYFPFLPYRLNDPGVRKRDLGLERWGDRELHKVEVTFVAGSSTDAEDVYLYWFDPVRGQLVQLAYSFHTGNGGLRFRRLINERTVGGLLFADHENYGVDGPGLGVERITPAYVAEAMKLLSVVELGDLAVAPLP